MTRVLVCLLMFAVTAFAQSGKARLDIFKKEAPALQDAINEVIDSTVPGMGLFQKAKATYLEGYGIVITLEASLEPTRNPFSSPKTPAEVRAIVSERRREIQQKLERFLKERTASLASLDSTDSIAIVLYLFNSNPADLPDLPAQVVLTAKKQDASRITLREF